MSLWSKENFDLIGILDVAPDSHQVCDHEFLQISVQHGIRVAGLNAGAQILDHLVRMQDIGADLAPPADLLLFAGDLGGLGLALRHFPLIQLGPQDLHGGGPVEVLAALGLAGHDDTGREMGDAHGRIGGVDMLPAGAAGAEGVHPQVGLADLDVDVILFDLGKDDRRGKGGVTAGIAVKGGDADQAVDAGFRLEVTVGVFAGDVEGRRLDSGLVTGLESR